MARDIWTPGNAGKPFAEVEPNPEKIMRLPDGRTFQENTVTISVEDAEMMWQGYKCARCLEPFSEAYPEKCIVCGFAVRELQRKQLEQDFLGHDPTRVGSFPLEREMEHLDRISEEM